MTKKRDTEFDGKNIEFERFMEDMKTQSAVALQGSSLKEPLEVLLPLSTEGSKKKKSWLDATRKGYQNLGLIIRTDIQDWSNGIQEVEIFQEEHWYRRTGVYAKHRVVEEMVVLGFVEEVTDFTDSRWMSAILKEKENIRKEIQKFTNYYELLKNNMIKNLKGFAAQTYEDLKRDYADVYERFWHPYMKINLFEGFLKTKMRHGLNQEALEREYHDLFQQENETNEEYLIRTQQKKVVLRNCGYEISPEDEFLHLLDSLNENGRNKNLIGYHQGGQTKYDSEERNTTTLINHLRSAEQKEIARRGGSEKRDDTNLPRKKEKKKRL